MVSFTWLLHSMIQHARQCHRLCIYKKRSTPQCLAPHSRVGPINKITPQCAFTTFLLWGTDRFRGCEETVKSFLHALSDGEEFELGRSPATFSFDFRTPSWCRIGHSFLVAPTLLSASYTTIQKKLLQEEEQ
jgi:hypothetical protein